MKMRIALLSAACALALSACGDNSDRADTQTATPPAATTDTAPAATTPTTPPAATTPPPAAPADTMAPAGDAAPAAAGDTKEAVVADCKTEIEGNDAIQYNVNAITVPASCTEFTITLKHVGQLPVAAMGHNVVITTSADMQAVVNDGMSAGLEADHIKPGDDRVIAHTKMIGGGETTSVTFPVSEIQGGGPYMFFCSFPGHAALMKGTITVE